MKIFFWNFFSEKLLSYRATELLSYWHEKNSGIFFRGENKATELPSYQATELLSYRHEKNFQRKKSYQATELPSYWATGIKNLRFHPHYLPLLKVKTYKNYTKDTLAIGMSDPLKWHFYNAVPKDPWPQRTLNYQSYPRSHLLCINCAWCVTCGMPPKL